MAESVDDIVKECLSGEKPCHITYGGQKYCTRLTGAYRKGCPFLDDNTWYVPLDKGWYAPHKWYNRCNKK